MLFYGHFFKVIFNFSFLITSKHKKTCNSKDPITWNKGALQGFGKMGVQKETQDKTINGGQDPNHQAPKDLVVG